jgi:hypothetical protein
MKDNSESRFARVCKRSSRPGRLVVALVLGVLAYPLTGCGFGGSASGEGSVDIARAKEAAKSNPGQFKGATNRERGGLGVAPQKPKGRR